MSDRTEAESTESTLAALSHLAFCALVALALARQDGMAGTPWAENMFLTRWLAAAQKQKRFPRSVAMDIALLLKRGRLHGPAARLPQKFYYLWHSCSGNIAAQSDLFRLTYATELLKDTGWGNRVVSEKEWAAEVIPVPVQANYFLVEKVKLNASFTPNGTLQTPVPFRITGDVAAFIRTMSDHGLHAHLTDSTATYHTILLSPPASDGSKTDATVL